MHAVFARLEAGVYRNRQIQLKARGHVFEACVTSVAIYGAAAWNFRDSHLAKLDSCYYQLLLRMLGHKRIDHVDWKWLVEIGADLSRTGSYGGGI